MELPGPPPHPQTLEDAEHLKLLSIFYYVLAALTALGGLFPLPYVLLGGAAVTGSFPPPSPSEPPPPVWAGWVFVAIGVVAILFIWAFAVGYFLTGRWISERRNRAFCFVMGCISCLSVPLGTALGVFTIVVLQRPSVRALFLRPPFR